MSLGNDMIWPLASEYAKRDWAVRRATWDDPDLHGDTGRALRWIVYFNALFWLVYIDATTGLKVNRVVRNSDFGKTEFLASDWTTASPFCLAQSGGSGGEVNQQGKLPYPGTVEPVMDPLYPNASHGTCPVVPNYFNA